jgi:hypothetical protein
VHHHRRQQGIIIRVLQLEFGVDRLLDTHHVAQRHAHLLDQRHDIAVRQRIGQILDDGGFDTAFAQQRQDVAGGGAARVVVDGGFHHALVDWIPAYAGMTIRKVPAIALHDAGAGSLYAVASRIAGLTATELLSV